MNQTFNYYGANIGEVVPLGEVSLDRFLNAIKQPKPKMKSILNAIREAAANNDENLKAELKKKLYFFTPAVKCTYRNYENIVSFTGLAPLDFDKLPDYNYAAELKEHIFNEYPFIVASWFSASRKGIRALVNIPIVSSPDEYKQYYNALIQIFSKYKGFDKAPQNCVLPLFISDDEDLLYRDNAVTFVDRYIPPPLAPKIQNITPYKDKRIQEVANVVNKSIAKIVDYGHPPLRAIAYALGGYVGNGYLTEDEAEETIISAIESNPYLSQRAKISGYIKTAKTMIEKGKQNPLEL